jgi:hypothetical protein
MNRSRDANLFGLIQQLLVLAPTFFSFFFFDFSFDLHFVVFIFVFFAVHEDRRHFERSKSLSFFLSIKMFISIEIVPFRGEIKIYSRQDHHALPIIDTLLLFYFK